MHPNYPSLLIVDFHLCVHIHGTILYSFFAVSIRNAICRDYIQMASTHLSHMPLPPCLNIANTGGLASMQIAGYVCYRDISRDITMLLTTRLFQKQRNEIG